MTLIRLFCIKRCSWRCQTRSGDKLLFLMTSLILVLEELDRLLKRRLLLFIIDLYSRFNCIGWWVRRRIGRERFFLLKF